MRKLKLREERDLSRSRLRWLHPFPESIFIPFTPCTSPRSFWVPWKGTEWGPRARWQERSCWGGSLSTGQKESSRPEYCWTLGSWEVSQHLIFCFFLLGLPVPEVDGERSLGTSWPQQINPSVGEAVLPGLTDLVNGQQQQYCLQRWLIPGSIKGPSKKRLWPGLGSKRGSCGRPGLTIYCRGEWGEW